MSGRLIALDKQPDVRHIGEGETWRRLFANIVLKFTVPEATIACQDDQLCAGINMGIDGVIHRVQALWDENSSTEEWGFLLVDRKNVFNKIIQVGMLWTVQHLLPSEALFVFDCYCHWSYLVLRNVNGTASIIHSREGVTQEYPIEMIA